jgi:hypothetical protein
VFALCFDLGNRLSHCSSVFASKKNTRFPSFGKDTLYPMFSYSQSVSPPVHPVLVQSVMRLASARVCGRYCCAVCTSIEDVSRTNCTPNPHWQPGELSSFSSRSSRKGQFVVLTVQRNLVQLVPHVSEYHSCRYPARAKEKLLTGTESTTR